MKVSVFQFSPAPGDIAANLDRAVNAARQASERGADFLLLPELWPTGLLSGKETEGAVRWSKKIENRLTEAAHEFNITIAGTIAASRPQTRCEKTLSAEDSQVRNTAMVVSPQGVTARYDKINLFQPMDEHRVFAPGTAPCLFTLATEPDEPDEITAGLLTCFDLRFPELARNLALQGAHILLVSALWPKARKEHFELLLRARAVENQCFVIASNACGKHKSMEFAGASCIIDPLGNVLASAGEGETLLAEKIDLASVLKTRRRFLSVHPPRQWAACTSSKVVTHQELLAAARRRRQSGQRMVFTNGCFDLLHPGHVSYLEQARREGDFLVIGLNSDASVKIIKGPARPVNSEDMRARVLAGLECVDYVTLFHDSTPASLIEDLLPDVLVKGADWAEDEIAGADTVKAAGGRVVRIKFTWPTSTTATIKKIQDRNG